MAKKDPASTKSSFLNMLKPAKDFIVGGLVATAEVIMPGQFLLKAKISAMSSAKNPVLMPRTLTGVYQGVGFHVGIMASVTATQMFVGGKVRALLDVGATPEQGAWIRAALPAVAGGVVSASFLGPLEQAMILQERYQAKYKQTFSIRATVAQAVKTEGIPRLFYGLGGTAARESVFTIAYMAAPALLRPYIQNLAESIGLIRLTDPDTAELAACVAAGALSGVGSQPLDLLKARRQMAEGRPQSYAKLASRVYAESGVAGFFKGGAWRVARVVPAVMIYNYGSKALKQRWDEAEANEAGFTPSN